MEPTATPDFAAHARRTLAALAAAGAPPVPDAGNAPAWRAAVAWLDAHLDRLDAGTLAAFDADGLGAVVGEAIRAATGGAWHHHPTQQAWGVRLPSGETAYPLHRAHRRLDGDLPGGGLLAFLDRATRA